MKQATHTGAFFILLIFLLQPEFSFSQPSSVTIQSAKKKYHSGDIAGAIADYTVIIKANPNNEEAFYERGRLYNEQKKYIEAIRDFSSAIELNPKNHRAYYLRGYTKYLAGNYQGAVSDLGLSIEIYPNSALALWYRAEARMKMGEKRSACEDWDKAYRLGYFEAAQKTRAHCEGINISSDVTADEYLRKGDLKLDKGDAEGALAEYLKAEKLNPHSGMIVYSIGLAKLILKDIAGACDAWQKAAGLGSAEARQMFSQRCD